MKRDFMCLFIIVFLLGALCLAASESVVFKAGAYVEGRKMFGLAHNFIRANYGPEASGRFARLVVEREGK